MAAVRWDSPLAEGMGFEPMRRHYRLRDFQSRALGQAMRPFQESGGEAIHLGGEGGIRTRGGVTHTNFRDWHLKPLGHLSAAYSSNPRADRPEYRLTTMTTRDIASPGDSIGVHLGKVRFGST